MTEPNGFDVFRRREREEELRRRTLVRALDVLIGLAVLAIVAVVVKMILY